MPLIGRAKIKENTESDFDYFMFWKAIVEKGVSPVDAWGFDFLETSILLDIEPARADFTFALYHQRKTNGAPEEWLQSD